MSVYKTRAQCGSVAEYVSQDFRPAFAAPGMFDRAAAKQTIMKARGTLVEVRAAATKLRADRKALIKLAQIIEDTINNADPMRSP